MSGDYLLIILEVQRERKFVHVILVTYKDACEGHHDNDVDDDDYDDNDLWNVREQSMCNYAFHTGYHGDWNKSQEKWRSKCINWDCISYLFL